MKRSNTKSLGDLLGEYIRQNGIENRLQEVDVVEYWNELLGPVMIRFTRNIRISKGVLYVELTSSVVRAELMMMREDLRNRINQKMGRDIVRQIIFR